MITVREIADELGKTPQGVNKYLRTSGLQKKVVKDGNRNLLPDDVAETVRNHFQKPTETETKTETPVSEQDKHESAPDNTPDIVIETLTEQLKVLQHQLEVCEGQLEIKDKQITALTEALANANETNKALSAANAVQIAADKKEILLAPPSDEEPPKEKKKGFWSRLFGM